MGLKPDENWGQELELNWMLHVAAVPNYAMMDFSAPPPPVQLYQSHWPQMQYVSAPPPVQYVSPPPIQYVSPPQMQYVAPSQQQ